MKRIVFLAMPAALLVAGCDDGAETEAEPVAQGGEVTGDVLGGTISDDMIPLEALQSQSPPTKRAAREQAGEEQADGDE